MQNIPAKESVGNRYRNAFTCPKGWVYVDSDYVSQELILIAYLSKDPVWQEALSKGQDLHSVCAELVYGPKAWRAAATDTCQYYFAHVDENGKQWLKDSKQKCNCKKHKILRTGIKSVNFGLCYGMSEFKLAGMLKISVKDAKLLIDDYFNTFPKIGRLLNYLGKFGVSKGYIQTIPPFYRKRWYPEWRLVPQYILDAHLKGIEHNPTLGSIERASKNQPIQGSAADITKLSLVYLRWFIRDNNLWDQIKLVMQVHDQNTTICVEHLAEKWKMKMTKLMEDAALFVIPNGLLKSETQITPRWSK